MPRPTNEEMLRKIKAEIRLLKETIKILEKKLLKLEVLIGVLITNQQQI